MPKNASVSSGLSRKSVTRRALMLLALLLVTGSIAYPPPVNYVIGKVNQVLKLSLPTIQKPFVLGLDLQGGTRLEYAADVSKVDPLERSSALDGVRDVIERRVNSIGVAEPSIQTAQAGEEWRVSVELAGIRDINQAIKLIGETPILEFKEQNDEAQRSLTPEERKKMDEDNAKAAQAAEAALARALKDPAAFESIVNETTQKDDTKVNGGDLGFIKDNPDYLEIYDAAKSQPAGTVLPKLIGTPRYDIVAKVEETKDAGMEINANHILIAFAGATNSTSTATKEEARKTIEDIQKQATPGNFEELAKRYSQEPGASESGGALGWFGKGVMVESFENPVFALAKGQISDIIETQFGYHLIYKADERPLNDVRVRATFFKKTLESDLLPAAEPFKNTELTGKNLKRAQLDFDQQSGSAIVSLVFDEDGSKLFAEITKRNIGKPLAIYLDGEAISIPTVNQEITGGQAVISGTFTIPEAKLLAQRLNAGALPIPINLIAQQSVGPSLGADSLQRSLTAGLVGFALVALFAILLYRLPGMAAVVVLVIYAALMATIFKLLPVTLTLSGIAGFILSIGMAIDSNVLVFERLKEELKAGRQLPLALEEAFKRAWTSIRDGHMTILISCAVLFWFSSAMIKGFAVTLAVGTAVSLFTATFATRTVLRVLIRTALAKWPRLFLASSKNV